ncbi:hypothetical protein UP17_05175 [Peribacillus simplex]|nr:hypothetical protein UP17_05175 [Peribacillus simplex]
MSSDPMNLIVNTSVGMWFWIQAILGIHYRPGVAFLFVQNLAGRELMDTFHFWRRERHDEK